MKIYMDNYAVHITPEEGDTAPRIILHGSGKGETNQGLMGWIELNLCPEDWKEVLVISAWNDKEQCGPHFEIASGADKSQGGVIRPISFWFNDNETHREVMRLTPEGVEVFGTLKASKVVAP